MKKYLLLRRNEHYHHQQQQSSSLLTESKPTSTSPSAASSITTNSSSSAQPTPEILPNPNSNYCSFPIGSPLSVQLPTVQSHPDSDPYFDLIPSPNSAFTPASNSAFSSVIPSSSASSATSAVDKYSSIIVGNELKTIVSSITGAGNMCSPLLLERIPFHVLPSHTSTAQHKPIPNNEEVDLEGFRGKEPSVWGMDDVIVWMIAVARKHSIPVEDINIHRFANCTGALLQLMNRQSFIDRDPVYGSLLHMEFRKLAKDETNNIIDEWIKTSAAARQNCYSNAINFIDLDHQEQPGTSASVFSGLSASGFGGTNGLVGEGLLAAAAAAAAAAGGVGGSGQTGYVGSHGMNPHDLLPYPSIPRTAQQLNNKLSAPNNDNQPSLPPHHHHPTINHQQQYPLHQHHQHHNPFGSLLSPPNQRHQHLLLNTTTTTAGDIKPNIHELQFPPIPRIPTTSSSSSSISSTDRQFLTATNQQQQQLAAAAAAQSIQDSIRLPTSTSPTDNDLHHYHPQQHRSSPPSTTSTRKSGGRQAATTGDNNKPSSYNKPTKLQKINKDGTPRKRSQHNKGNKLWEFILDALKDPLTCPSVVRWEDAGEGVFRIVESESLARLWGQRKNNQKMTYEKLSRAMRTYYDKSILVPVPKTGMYPKKLVYKFGPAAYERKRNKEMVQP